MTQINADAHIRLARPVRDLAAAERFYAGGLGLDVLYRGFADGPGEHDIVMVGLTGAAWHLELVCVPGPGVPDVSEHDLLVIYLDGSVPDSWGERIVAAGGSRVSAGPYWDRWGVTFADPDGHRVVLSTRNWANTPEVARPPKV
ncbi:catechol 2,3-dioxygenase-like lactoylglutathione lyase family enzyme [Actinoplanes lutulentus]|uniref:Catechol 2,3-dioxygenase-like lactoylglutathione lyase family enzyme n=1 Tax=Actinoplanes lutulentus TaxID=1287878 RepID=A0A327ZCE1_9ACTN|nr:VOC family protein [Actinoplanes lutulentus]MBB2941389.1 catechol 2,3-dioxygenase-like lactoylglutathione lyase family enzyme [Actinoplanes lutulentus]RAK36880.1 catechol 2,3-dioxygenase-like lactoylglutathione lyase family enzyme [Actinoplanes lutulentus]